MDKRELIILGGSGYIGSCLRQHIEKNNIMDRVNFVFRSDLKSKTRMGNIVYYLGNIPSILKNILSDQDEKKQFGVINLIGRVTNKTETLSEIEKVTGTVFSILDEKKITKF